MNSYMHFMHQPKIVQIGWGHHVNFCVWKKSAITFGEGCISCTCVDPICLSDNRKWQDYVYIQCEYKSTKQKIKHLLREENKVKENKIS